MQDRPDEARTGRKAPQPAELPYRIELWSEGEGDQVERVLARAVSLELAHAILKAALVEYPGRRITLGIGRRVLDDSAR